MIVLASDHAGVGLKAEVVRLLEARGEEYRDLGPFDDASVDYPEYAHLLAAEITAGRADRGVLVCGTGIGMSMAANRHPGIRAAVCHDAYTAEMARRHNDANVLCMGGRVIGAGVALQIVEVFLDTAFEGGRHQRRAGLIEPPTGRQEEK
ncbi:MAG TPA: ribose 5-phosphate isomerase B [Thermoanaerobaculales bacterium]|nr:ribose 5-phosphate isomerase B [Thermoanaerobaculales bacterium]HPA79875.1 ribose 5-phosphate isomerase B [Thermoanaerobaculales bacterium]HQL28757.1 ribose 5-phosphate isomerase B [Thermoanaerobaculales bacterium]HQN96133.1 ribose 5-phosphate isomerase B [Thermoanaerobaculales bacterium]